jgi:pimeloyl-ACP methyl ester carboxylesterase
MINTPGVSFAPKRVDQAVLDDLRCRLRATRRIGLPRGVGWDRGMDVDYLTDLLDHWANAYDWRGHEERIGELPWACTSADGFAARCLHQRASRETAEVVVLLHGWPDSILRFERVLPLLTDVNVVVPCLPGFPFSEPLTEPGMSTTAMAEVVAGVMSELGYERYVVSGGDIGSSVAETLAHRHPDQVGALHLTDVPYGHLLTIDDDELSDEERGYVVAGRRWRMTEGGYALEQSTKPHTLAVALGDSPAGLAAWIIEKLRGWSDCDGDVESVFAREELLTWVTAYWVTGTIGTSFSPYVERREPVGRVQAPTAVTLLPHDLLPAPRVYAERFFDVRVWDEQPDGGHFAAWERPSAFVQGIRDAVALQHA